MTQGAMAKFWVLFCAVAADCDGESCQKNVTRDHLLLQRKVSSVTKSGGRGGDECHKQFVNLGSGGEPGMTECQGDCDDDSDCAPGLKCKQRRWDEDVPGCFGFHYNRFDYCYNPACDSEGMPELDSSYGSQGGTNMPKCAGDCDENTDCAGGLKCFQRDDREAVPGCSGSGVRGFDYCYDPADGTQTSQTTTMPPSSDGDCLCVFDIDRTLTGKQGTAGNECAGNKEIRGIRDYAYSPGWLTISDAGQNLQRTFCNQCYLGIVSAGWASGDDEKDYLLDHVLLSEPYTKLRDTYPKAARWSRRRTLGSPLVLGWPDRKKQDAVEGIVTWYGRKGITIPASKVTFFGDRTENIGPFASKGYNSREISCGSRDSSIHNGMVGYCGGLMSEIVETNGVKLCSDPEQTTLPPADMAPPAEGQPTTATTTPSSGECLCVFDIDRTLTGKQGIRGRNSACPANKKARFIWDAAYSGGWLHLSEAGQNLKQTFCNACYLGVVSAGSASGRGSAERRYLLKNVLKSRPFKRLRRKHRQASRWSSGEVNSPLVLSWPDRRKQDAVKGIVEWYGRKDIHIAPTNVHFFGDRTENIGPFRDSGFNSREISCATRDYTIGNGIVGLCGAELHEIVDTKGVAEC